MLGVCLGGKHAAVVLFSVLQPRAAHYVPWKHTSWAI